MKKLALVVAGVLATTGVAAAQDTYNGAASLYGGSNTQTYSVASDENSASSSSSAASAASLYGNNLNTVVFPTGVASTSDFGGNAASDEVLTGKIIYVGRNS